ncbi:MAG: AAA family ATPase [Rickettsiales bacterium]
MNYIGDIDNIHNIENFLLSKKNHHSIILSGEKGIGKSLAAKNIIENILKKQGSNKIYNLKWVSPDSKSGKITIDQIRELNGFLTQTEFDGKSRFVVVDAADDLNVNSANILLKPLEEPKHNCFFILINHKSSQVLPTIRSRCVNFRFQSPSKKQSEEILMPYVKYNEELAKKYLLMATYNIGNATVMAQIKFEEFYKCLLASLKEKNLDFIKFNILLTKLDVNENWNLIFILLKRICYILLNTHAEVMSEEGNILNYFNHIDRHELGKLIDHIQDMEYKIANLYLNKKDCIQSIYLKIHSLCQKTFI